MSRAVLVAIAVAVVTSASPSQPPPPKDKVREKAWAPNLSQAILRSKEEKKPLAILFGADWAVAYTKLRGNFYDTPEFDRFVDKAVFVVGNPDKDDDVKARFSTFGVNGFPTLVVLDEKQAEIDRVTGRWEPEVYGGKLEALFRNVETYRKTGKTDFGEDAADKAHPHRLAAKLAAAGQAEVAKMVLDPKDRLTEDRLHALVLQTDARATLAPPRGKDAAREYGLEIKGSQFHGFAMSVGEQSIVLRRPLTSFGKADQVPPEALRKMLLRQSRSGATYVLDGEPAVVQLVLTLDRDTSVGRLADRIRLLVEDCDEAVTQVLPLLVGTPKKDG